MKIDEMTLTHIHIEQAKCKFLLKRIEANPTLATPRKKKGIETRLARLNKAESEYMELLTTWNQKNPNNGVLYVVNNN